MENNNGKGIFYGVIGVATLIVAIIGATFAYFTATTQSGQYVTGTAATASLAVTVQRLTGYSVGEGAENASSAKFTMVPQLDKGLSAALVGTTVSGVSGAGAIGTKIEGGAATTTPYNTACIDNNGSLVCSIYKITVQNTGSSAIDVSGTINFYGTATDTLTANGEDNTAVTAGDSLLYHLKWARLADPSTLTANYTNAQAVANTSMPTTLLTYGADAYDTLADGTERKYVTANANQYLYAMNVTGTSNKDLLGTDKTVVTGAHGAYTDLIDPTDDLLPASNYAVNSSATAGAYHLEANGQTGDTKVYYIVVWISENEQAQNADDFGTFTGQVTFNSAGGSGATSTFTEAYSGS